LLLDSDAEVNALDDTKNTPLHDACSDTDRQTLRLLIERGADIHARNAQGEMPIHVAVSKRNLNAVKVLVGKGADLKAEVAGQTPLEIAELRGYTVIATFLRREDERE
jgi:ankyrin repeat protein